MLYYKHIVLYVLTMTPPITLLTEITMKENNNKLKDVLKILKKTFHKTVRV